MRRLLLIFALCSTFAYPQQILGPIMQQKPAGGGGGGISYASQNCTGGGTTSTTSQACSASMTVSTGDIIVVGSTLGSTTANLSSITHTGTASVTWTVVSGTRVVDSPQIEVQCMAWGQVTAGGTVTPTATWNVSGNDSSIIAADFTGATAASDGGNGNVNAAVGSGANAQTSGSITTTNNGDLLTGFIADTTGAAATVTAGTTSVSYTKIVCTTVWGGQSCIEWGTQTTAGASTQANWTFSNSDRSLASILAIK